MDKVIFIGAGNVACHLAPALHEAGYDIVQVFSRTEPSACNLAEQIGARFTTALAAIDPTADVYLYAVTDSALPGLAARVNAPDALHLHTSGSTGLDVFAGHARHFGVLYPLQTFSKHKAIRFPEINFFIEGNDDFARRKVREMASTLSRHVQELDSAGRKRMHLAAVFACNFTNHLYEIAAELLAEAGIDFRVMLPLIDETTEKIKTLSPYEAQTGPAVRNDRNITDKHLALLAGKRELETIYCLLTDDIHAIHQKGQNP